MKIYNCSANEKAFSSCLTYTNLLLFSNVGIYHGANVMFSFLQQIQKLVAPPVSEEYARRMRRRDREHRRHGRSVNHDCCDSCKEGGDLLCCDRCPAAFHLQCQ